MEDERLKELLERVLNFDWEMPRPSAERVAYEVEIERLRDLWSASTDETERGDLWRKIKAEPPTEVRAEYGQFRKRIRDFERALRRDFPEWHFKNGSRVGQFAGGIGGRGSFQSDLRKVWEFASEGQRDKAKRGLRRTSDRFMRSVEGLSQASFSRYNRKKDEMEVVPSEPRPSESATLRRIVDVLEWLQNRLGMLKVCENPRCGTGRKYFFRIYPNDRYCCNKCTVKAKAIRQAQRSAESQKPPKEYVKSASVRENMSIGQTKRWDKHRAKTGKPKYAS